MKLLLFGEKCFRKFALFGILVCLACYCYVYLDYLTDKLYTTTTLHNPYFVNTLGCKIVALDVMNPRIRSYVKVLEDINCEQRTWFRTKVYKGSWTLELVPELQELLEYNGQLMGNNTRILCKYWQLRRLSDYNNVMSSPVKFALEAPWQVVMPRDVRMVRLICYIRDEEKDLHRDVHFFVQPIPVQGLSNVSIRLSKWPRSKHVKKASAAEPMLSVMILGIDSISHLNFIRQMPQTAAYIRTQLPHCEFWGYNKVGYSSYSNLMPMFSGLTSTQFDKKCTLNGAQNTSNCRLIWQYFKRAGYNTSFGEDETELSLFNYDKLGFAHPPTDHYLRPTLVEMDNFARTDSNNKFVHCCAGRTYADVLFEHIEALLPHKRRHPFFSFYWWKQGLRDYLNYPQKLDFRLFKLLQLLHSTGITNNTFILLMSDHGTHWGPFRQTYQGMLEDGLPLLLAMYPPWLKRLYPQALANLERNERSLITTHDIHRTLRDLINLTELSGAGIAQRSSALQQLSYAETPVGVSLFLPVPPWRTCETSLIPDDYCMCHKLQTLTLDDRRAQRAARGMVRSINELLRPFSQCQYLKLNAVLMAYHSSTQRELQKWYTQAEAEHEVKVRLETVPGGAQFEATTRFTGYTMGLIGAITRVDDYRQHSYCIEGELKMYCYCVEK